MSRPPSLYNNIKFRLAKAILDDWFRPHCLMEETKLRPLQLATGLAASGVPLV